jgi:hypothetical protein
MIFLNNNCIALYVPCLSSLFLFVICGLLAAPSVAIIIIIIINSQLLPGFQSVRITYHVVHIHYSAEIFRTTWRALSMLLAAWKYVDHGEDSAGSNRRVIFFLGGGGWWYHIHCIQLPYSLSRLLGLYISGGLSIIIIIIIIIIAGPSGRAV